MTTAKVIRAFTCVNSRVYYTVGAMYEADLHRIQYLVNKGYLQAPAAHIPKAEVVAPSKAEVTHDYATPTHKPPKRKRNEHK